MNAITGELVFVGVRGGGHRLELLLGSSSCYGYGCSQHFCFWWI